MASAASAALPVTTVCFNSNTVDDRKSSFFEFKPPSRSNMVMRVIDVNSTLMSMTLTLVFLCLVILLDTSLYTKLTRRDD